MKLLATVNTPWARKGNTFETDTLTRAQERYLTSGVLADVSAVKAPRKKATRKAATKEPDSEAEQVSSSTEGSGDDGVDPD